MMYWLTAGLLALGACCGATIRLMVFLVLLLVAALIGVVACSTQGIGAALVGALVPVVSLQIGYGAGLALRSRIAWLWRRPRAEAERTVRGRLGEGRH
jgi:hypothetical protein